MAKHLHMGRRELKLSLLEHCCQRRAPSREIGKEVMNIIVLRLCVGDVHADALNDQVLSAQGLGNLVICKGDEGVSPEGLGDEDVCDFPVLHEELPQFFCGHVFCAPANKHFSASHWLIWTLLRVGKFTVAPPAVNHVAL
uniref:Uncharacterized protein n=1 Tax=Anguilla anguilla TaxID=7936 RepID=A0A0E9XBR3_ANGAN